ncbi:transposase [Gluconobacter oxydans]|uniref:Transposase n=1 Tax=Gluconobacter oxydans TaxID=442 RepID=A0AB35AR68_GLUOY|nr:transposase [Gluconobacter oxydans]
MAGHGWALSFTLSPGQAHELPSAYALLDDLPHPPTYVVCDRGYASHKFHEYLWDRGSRPVIPPRKNGPEVACPKWAYRHRRLEGSKNPYLVRLARIFRVLAY